MWSKILLFVLILVLMGTAHAYQNTEPELSSVDCGAVNNFIEKWEAMQRMLRRHDRELYPQELERLEEVRHLNQLLCWEV